MNAAARLTIDIHGYWHPGTGRGRGAGTDALSHQDANGLPELPGRSVRGLLRQAVHDARLLGWYGEPENAPGYDDILFGTNKMEAGIANQPGWLRVDTARLPTDVAAWLAQSGQHRQRAELYRTIYSTAIDPQGSAKDGSLRSQEVVVPLTLTAGIDIMPRAQEIHESLPEDWANILQTALPLISAVGSKRNRGLGRATLSLEVTE